ncbi:type II secretion system F family protein [Mycobacterium sp. 94-17]|uniref:type II secretion system F family protein n=1 Tax=Mycobacterium sp. 94-17 TaxID=2986147 RepID=UPI002D1E8DED|nr:type II secretion system F family protein [Mycobacterium sp. 94-17]MEB4207547.1 type II secretion system F family protein [Mycobacterium sp. 94-17]
MNGPPAGALLLALAVIASQSAPRRRLPGPRQRRVPAVGLRGVGLLAAAIGCTAAIVLPLTTVLCIAVVGTTAGLRYRRRVRIRRATAEGHALQSALEVLVGELRAGAHPVRAFRVAADDTAGAVAVSLRSVAARARLGADVAAGLAAAGRRSELSAHWERLALCWRLANDNGLGISTLMRTAQRDIAERQRFSARVTSSMAGARATAAILAALPVLGVLLGQLIGARPLDFLLGGRAGGWLMLVGSALTCVGLLWSDRIADRVAS